MPRVKLSRTRVGSHAMEIGVVGAGTGAVQPFDGVLVAPFELEQPQLPAGLQEPPQEQVLGCPRNGVTGCVGVS